MKDSRGKLDQPTSSSLETANISIYSCNLDHLPEEPDSFLVDHGQAVDEQSLLFSRLALCQLLHSALNFHHCHPARVLKGQSQHRLQVPALGIA